MSSPTFRPGLGHILLPILPFGAHFAPTPFILDLLFHLPTQNLNIPSLFLLCSNSVLLQSYLLRPGPTVRFFLR